MELYPWVVIGHVFFVIIAFGAHGTSAFAMLQARRELFGVMTPLGANPMSALRKTLGLPGRGDKPGMPSQQPGSTAEVQAAQARVRPELPATIGIVAIAVLVWLMEAKPF